MTCAIPNISNFQLFTSVNELTPNHLCLHKLVRTSYWSVNITPFNSIAGVNKVWRQWILVWAPHIWAQDDVIKICIWRQCYYKNVALCKTILHILNSGTAHYLQHIRICWKVPPCSRLLCTLGDVNKGYYAVLREWERVCLFRSQYFEIENVDKKLDGLMTSIVYSTQKVLIMCFQFWKIFVYFSRLTDHLYIVNRNEM